jgi:hypothetical protein
MNILNRDKREMQSAFKYQLIFIIIMFIMETQLIVHTSERLNHTIDLFEYVYPAFPIFGRRFIMKAIIIPVTFFIENFYKQFVMSDSEIMLKRLAGWLAPDTLIEVRSKLKKLDTNSANKHLDSQLDAIL